jgi:hypothetical protein
MWDGNYEGQDRHYRYYHSEFDWTNCDTADSNNICQDLIGFEIVILAEQWGVALTRYMDGRTDGQGDSLFAGDIKIKSWRNTVAV